MRAHLTPSDLSEFNTGVNAHDTVLHAGQYTLVCPTSARATLGQMRSQMDRLRAFTASPLVLLSAAFLALHSGGLLDWYLSAWLLSGILMSATTLVSMHRVGAELVAPGARSIGTLGKFPPTPQNMAHFNHITAEVRDEMLAEL